MNRKLFIIILAVLLLLSVLGGGAYLYLKSSQNPVSPVVISTVSPTPEPVSEWKDQAQFTFSYPESLTVDPHPENMTDYAQVELKSASHSGSLTIWVKDTKAETIDDWITQNKVEGSLDSTLGGADAKRFIDSSDKEVMSVAGLQFGYLYRVDAKLTDRDFWNRVSDTVLESFKFTENTDTAASSSSGSDETYSEDAGAGDEEIIE